MIRGKCLATWLIGAAALMAVAKPADAVNDLRLNVAAGSVCVSASDTVTVTLDASNLSAAVNGVQVLLQYNPALMTLVDIVPTDLGLTPPAAGWVEVSQSDNAGQVTWAAVINGGSIGINHTIATLTFTAIADGTAGVSFAPDAPPIVTKLTRASDNATLTPTKFDSGGVFIGPPDCTITAESGVCLGTAGHVASVPNAGVGATYAWTVTGGTITSGQGTTSITYTAGAGASVTIDITVTDPNGCPSTCQTVVPINPNPSCTITAADSVCANSTGNPASVPSAGVGATYSWTVTGGTLTSGQGTPTIAFSAGAGPTVTVDITVTDANGCTSACQKVISVAAPDCTITAANAACSGSAGHVASVPDAGVGATYSWTVTGGTITAGVGTRTITYTAGIGATVTIDVTVVGNAGCQSSCQKIVSVNANPNCTITAEDFVCDATAGHVASVPSAGAGATYSWTVSGGTINSGQGTTSISYTATNPLSVTIDITVTDANGCVSTCQKVVTVDANPACTVTADPAVCAGTSGHLASVQNAGVGATYAWTVTGGTINAGQGTDTISYTATSPTSITIAVTVTDANGCVSSCQTIVSVNANPSCTITSADAVCDGSAGNTASVPSAGVGATYSWSVTGGTLTGGQGTTTMTYTAGSGPTLTINVTVTDANGCVSTCQKVVNVAANPTCTLTGANAVCNGSTGNVVTTADVGVGATYAWSVTGGTLTGGQNTPSLTYTAGAGPTVTINLTVTDPAGCISTCQKVVTVNPLPDATITSAAAVCASSTANAASVPSAGVGATYSWSATGGTIDGTPPYGNAVTFTAGTGASMTLNVTVTNANGCTSNSSKIVTINALPNATITTAAAVCTGSTGNAASVADAGVGATYNWTVTGGTIAGTPPFGNAITYTAGAGPSVTIDVTVTNANGCVSSSSTVVTVNPLPSSTITTAPAVCDGTPGHSASVPSAGAGASYAWTVTGGTINSGQNTTTISYTAGAGPTITVSVTVTNANGCVSTSQAVVNVNPNPGCAITSSDAVCSGTTGHNAFVTDAGVGATYSWTVTGGTLTAGQGTTSITYTAGTGLSVTLAVTVTDSNGCVSSCQKIVTINANPDCTISANNLVCATSSGNVASVPSAGVGASYVWNVTGGTLNSGQGTTSISYTAGTGTSLTISITVTNANGCVSTCNKVVTVNAPDCTISGADSVCFNSVGNFATVPSAGAGATYAWTVTGTGASLQTGQGTTAITYRSGTGTSVTLQVTVTNSNGCISTCQKIVTVIQPSLDVTLQVEGLTAAVTRNVTFAITTCGGSVDTRVLPVAFDALGNGSVIVTNTAPTANWVSAREGHTLRQLASITYGTCSVATIDLTGLNKLQAGDFQTATVAQDNLVDITDFSILASRWNVAIDPTLSTGADATGDGLQATADFTTIQANFFALGENADACVLGLVDGGSGGGLTRGVPTPVDLVTRPMARISAKVQDLGFTGAERADLNADGVVDAADIRMFAQQNGLRLTAEFAQTLDKMDLRSVRVKRGR